MILSSARWARKFHLVSDGYTPRPERIAEKRRAVVRHFAQKNVGPIGVCREVSVNRDIDQVRTERRKRRVQIILLLEPDVPLHARPIMCHTNQE